MIELEQMYETEDGPRQRINGCPAARAESGAPEEGIGEIVGLWMARYRRKYEEEVAMSCAEQQFWQRNPEG